MSARRLSSAEAGFMEKYRALLAQRGERLDKAEIAARAVVEAVRARGMDAVLEATQRFDGLSMDAAQLRVTQQQLNSARAACEADLLTALELAVARIYDFHARQRPKDERWTDAAGMSLGWRWSAVESAGLYAPGGLAAYPSSVLMNAAPARAAGVKRLVMTTPPARLDANPAILAAAEIAGVDEIWAIGGAQAIAAMAYGAGDLAPCDVVVGPGNAYVAAAKKIVFGDVGVDAVAGPSEVFILSDGSAPAAWIAADLLAQAEHDADAQSVLFTTSESFAATVAAEVEAQIAAGEAGDSARASWDRHGAIILVRDLEEACLLSDFAAPEHVQIACADEGLVEALSTKIKHAGALFLGVRTPEALGDYLAGPSHVLPTARAARYASGVNVLTFMKRTTIMSAGEKAMRLLGPHGARIADSEGLPAHAQSIRRRLEP